MAVLRALSGSLGFQYDGVTTGSWYTFNSLVATSTTYAGENLRGGGYQIALQGSGFGNFASFGPTTGTITVMTVLPSLVGERFSITDMALPAATYAAIVQPPGGGVAQPAAVLFANALSGENQIFGGPGPDRLPAYGIRNTIDGGDGPDIVDFTFDLSAARAYEWNGQAVVFGIASQQLDRLVNVERLSFTGGSLDLAGLPDANPLEYIASYADLRAAFGANAQAGFDHLANRGILEGRVASFDGLAYVASYADLRAAFGPNGEAGAGHYIVAGLAEGRTVSFDGLAYIASYADLSAALPRTATAGAAHFIASGASEGRVVAFDPLEYIASNADLISAYGANATSGSLHYITTGRAEGRSTDSFNAPQYLANYADLRAAFGADIHAATLHYISTGYAEHRTDHPLL